MLKKNGGPMKNLILLAFTLSLSVNSLAGVILTKTYDYQPEMIKALEDKVLKAQARPLEMMDYPIALIISDELALWCPSHLPANDGLGCSVIFEMGQINGTKLTVKKDVDVLGKYEGIKSKLENTPLNTDEHLHFGSIFSDDTSEGSHYFCYSNEIKDDWKCELFVREEL